MSGGSMDYIGFKVEQAIEDIRREIESIEKMQKTEVDKYFRAADYYKKNYPDAPFFKSPEALRKAVLKRLRDACKTVKAAATYLVRVEWLTSADDGYESFVLRTDEELNKDKPIRRKRKGAEE